MSHVLIRHKIKNYESWKPVFDRFKETRRLGGEKSYWISHPSDDPNNLFLLFEWDTLENAKKFLGSPILRDTMQKAGVTELPEVHFLEEVEKGAATLSYART